MPSRDKVGEITRGELEELLKNKAAQVVREPEHTWSSEFCSYMKDSSELPAVRLSLVNCKPEMDIWEGLRSPAQVGMHPLGLPDIWMHYAASNVRSTREDGSPNPLAMPETFEEVLRRYRRAVIISAMLAVNPAVYEAYAKKIEREDEDPADYYQRARDEVSAIINKAVGKLALSLMAPGRAVVPMTKNNVARIIERTRSAYFQGRYHGPCNHHYPQNSIAVMTGLMRFGANRLVFRDEVAPDGKVRRLFGLYSSIILFDEEDPVTDGSGGVGLLDAGRLAWLRRISDYTDTAPEVVQQRYCTYNTTDSSGDTVCGKCLQVCPSEALANSTPRPDGSFEDRILHQKHRFWEGVLDFDYGNCSRFRNQKSQLYDEYACGRCEAVCAAAGVRKSTEEIESTNSRRAPAD